MSAKLNEFAVNKFQANVSSSTSGVGIPYQINISESHKYIMQHSK